MIVRALLFVLVPSVALAADTKPPRIAVMPLASIRGVDKEVAKLLSDTMTLEIERLNRYEVVSADDVQAMLGLEKLKDAVGCSDASCVAEIGGALGVNLMVSGTLGTLGKQVKISLTLFDTKKLRALKRAQKFVDNDESLLDYATREVVAELFDAPAPKPTGPTPVITKTEPAIASQSQPVKEPAKVEPQPTKPVEADTPKTEPAPAPIEPVNENAWLREDTEWFTLRLGASLLGFGLATGLFNVRWRSFYYQVLRFDLMMPLGLGIYGVGGTFGFPIFFSNDRHELRIGGAPMLMFYQRSISSFLTMAPVIATEVVYVWHATHHVALQAGLVGYFPIAPIAVQLGGSGNPVIVSVSLTVGAAF